MTTPKRILVDMSATLLHHGHVRLLEKAKALGEYVIVALTTDDEILKHKGYASELSYDARKEILLSLSCVDEVIPSPWCLDDSVLKACNADVLLHSGVNENHVSSVLSCDRTEGISSTSLRMRSLEAITVKRNTDRCLLTPGPTNLHPESIADIYPVFTRGDEHYISVRNKVLENVRRLAGQDSIATMQGSATTAIEVAIANFLIGKVVVVTSGFYSERMLTMIQQQAKNLGLSEVSSVSYDSLVRGADGFGKCDWVVASYTETGAAVKSDMRILRRASEKNGARLMVDATGSINLEDNHELADVCMFSSCKGLGGITGAGFITFNRQLLERQNESQKPFTLELQTYLESKTTSPAHALCSLDSISEKFGELKQRVLESKEIFLSRYRQYTPTEPERQPALCTKLQGVKLGGPEWMVMYQPRTLPADCQIICHLFDQFPSNRPVGAVYDFLQLEELPIPESAEHAQSSNV